MLGILLLVLAYLCLRDAHVREGYRGTTIAVCVPCVPKHVERLPELIGSVRKQTRLPDEFIVALSETTDEEAQKLEEELSNDDFNVIITPKATQAYAGENRNRAAKKSTSTLVSFIDSDDLMHPLRLEIIASVYDQFRPRSIVHFFEPEGSSTDVKYDPAKVEDSKVLQLANQDKETPHLRQFPMLHHGHITTERKLFDEIQQSEDMRVGEDSLFVRKILGLSDEPNIMYLIRQPLTTYRASLSTCPYGSPCWHEAISAWGEPKPVHGPPKPVPCRAEMIVAFSLWGHGDCYNYGALENAITSPKHYPAAVIHFYVDIDTAQKKIIRTLSKMPHVRVIPSEGSGKMFWRFKPAFYEEKLPVLVRDTDSLVSQREVSAVQEWLDGDKDFHIMRDANGHDFHILGGMWGTRNGFILPLKKQFKDHVRGVSYGADQNFLRDVVYPYVKGKAEVHDEIFKYDPDAKRFPVGRGPSHEYVGRIICHSPNAFRLLGESHRELSRDRIEAYKHIDQRKSPENPLNVARSTENAGMNSAFPRY